MSPHPLTEEDRVRFRDLLSDRIGMVVPDLRRVDLERAVTAALGRTGLKSPTALYAHLLDGQANGDALAAMIPEVVVGETHFFRNRAQMEALERDILPAIIERRRSRRRIRVWSAGCSSGEEPYSLAMLLDRAVPDLSRWEILVLATDVNPAALEKARRGIYTRWSFREVPDQMKQRYFHVRGSGFEMDERIRDAVTFEELNLAAGDWPEPRRDLISDMDLILCRNVLMYFRPPTVRRVLERLHGSLADDGWLVVGHTEPSSEAFDQFELRDPGGSFSYQKSTAPERTATDAVQRLRAVAAAAPKPVRQPPSSPRVSPVAPHTPSASMPTFDGAVALVQQGSLGQALAAFAALAATDDRAPYEAARICAGRLRLEAAEHWIELARRAQPLSPRVHYLSGIVLQERGKIDEALEALRRCLYADPDFALGHYAVAGLFAQLGQPGRAEKALQNAVRLIECNDRGGLVPDGDGLTFGGLLDQVNLRRTLLK